MKTKDLIKDVNKSRALREQITMEIGELYAEYVLLKNESLLSAANSKVELLKKVTDHIRDLEREIVTSSM